MATAVALHTQVTFVPDHAQAIKNLFERGQKVIRQYRTEPFSEKWKRAKAQADGGIVFFALDGNVIVFNEDAELVAGELGLYFDGEPLAGCDGMEKSLQIKRSHFGMYALLLRADGYQDIWIASVKGAGTATDFLDITPTFRATDAARTVMGMRKS